MVCQGGQTPAIAAAATPRSDATDSVSVTGQTPARTPMRDKLSINPDEDMYGDGDIPEHQQVSSQSITTYSCISLAVQKKYYKYTNITIFLMQMLFLIASQ